MPQLTVRGIAPEIIADTSTALITELADLMDTDTDNFTLDVLITHSYHLGKSVPTFPFIQIGWFDRGQSVKDKVAKAIDQIMVNAGILGVEIAFIPFEKASYYADGDHY